jgi:hypothetical protein
MSRCSELGVQLTDALHAMQVLSKLTKPAGSSATYNTHLPENTVLDMSTVSGSPGPSFL